MTLPARGALGTVGSATGANLAVSWPVHLANQFGLIVAESGDEPIALSDAQGFVQLPNSPQGTGIGGGTATRLGLFGCISTSDAMPSPTIANPGDHIIARIVTFTGVNVVGNAWDGSGTLPDGPFGSVLTAASSAVSISGFTTLTADCLIVMIVANGLDSSSDRCNNDFANADLANVSKWSGTNKTDGNGGGFAIATGEKAVAGLFGATTATLVASSQQARYCIALKPFVATGGAVVRSKMLGARQAIHRASRW